MHTQDELVALLKKRFDELVPIMEEGARRFNLEYEFVLAGPRATLALRIRQIL